MDEGVLLSELAAAIGGQMHGADRCIRHLSIDSRQPFQAEDTLFIALRGKHHDGHNYLPDLRKHGVRNFLVKAGATKLNAGDSAIEVADTLRALQALAAWHRGQFNLPVVGITGSNGKTVVKEWLNQLLVPEERIVRSPGSWNSQVGVPLSVWEIQPEHTLGLFEAGISEPGEMDALERIIAPTIGVFTNIGPAHGAGFASDAAKAAEKAKLFRHAKTVVYCRDHTVVHEALSELKGVQLLGWGRNGNADAQVKSEVVNGDASAPLGVSTSAHGDTTRLGLRWKDREFGVELPFVDAASVENALHCIAVMLLLGRDPDTIARRVRHLQPVSMRMQLLPGLQNTTLLNDAYSNDLASLTNALNQLARTAGGRRKVVVLSDIAGSADDPEARHARMAALLGAAQVDQLIAVGPGLQEHAALFPEGSRFFADTESLLQALPQPPLNGAVVLVKGARRFGLERAVERWEERTHGTVMEVSTEALRHNLNHYRELCSPRVCIMAMVKAGGYGSGAVELARFFAHEQVAYLGVAYADEGIELRRQGIRTPVLVMNPEPVPMEVLHRHHLEAEVYDQRSLQAALDFAAHVPDAPPVHLKLDTGMHRLGFQPDELPALLDALRHQRALRVASIFSHLAASEDPAEDAFTRHQLESFRRMAAAITEVTGPGPVLHIANSAAVTRFPEARLDMVRLGIGLHGIGANAEETARLQPVETLRTVIAQVKEIPAGDTIGYGRRGKAAKPMRLAILPIGYADGLSRRLGEGQGLVYIHGQAAPTVGSICMDMCMVDVTDIACHPSDDAFLFSPEHPVQEYAQRLGTIPYEALTAISPRVKRVFVQE